MRIQNQHSSLVLAGSLAVIACAAVASPAAASLVNQMDLSDLYVIGNVTLPAGSSTFDPAALSASGLGTDSTGEVFGVDATEGTIVFSSSSNYKYLWDPAESDFYLNLEEESPLVAPAAPDPPGLTTHTEQLMASVGIPTGEVGDIEEAAVMRQDILQGGVPTPPVLYAHKRFVERRIAGIPVLGSGLVTTYRPDFTLVSMTGQWPGLASSGHVLTTPLGPTLIAHRVEQHLLEIGITDVGGTIELGYVYQPSPAQSGRVRLTLKVAAVLNYAPDPENDVSGEGELIRVELVDIRSLDRLNPVTVKGCRKICIDTVAGMNVQLTIATPGELRERIYDVRGRLVSDLGLTTVGLGPHDRRWNGRNSAGDPVANGVYFYVAEMDGDRLEAKILHLR